MRILFCKVANMKNYQGVDINDKPQGGGAYVDNTDDALEKYNFKERISVDGKKECYGYFETKHVGGSNIYVDDETGRRQLHIEKINGCENFKYADHVDDVLVIFCTTIKGLGVRVVGWYRHATVYRDCQKENFGDETQYYFAKTESDNATLVPYQERGLLKWEVPSATKKDGPGFGFGQSLHWYATGKRDDDELNERIEEFLASMVSKINRFDADK